MSTSTAIHFWNDSSGVRNLRSNSVGVYRGDFSLWVSFKRVFTFHHLPTSFTSITTKDYVLPLTQKTTAPLGTALLFDTYVIDSDSRWKQFPLKKPTLMRRHTEEYWLSKLVPQEAFSLILRCHTFQPGFNFLLELHSEKVIKHTCVII